MNNLISTEPGTRHHDLVAAGLSIIPGLGQLYKGHRLEATFIALLTTLLAIWIGTLCCLAYAVGFYASGFGIPVRWVPLLLNPVTLGLGLAPLLVFWAIVALEAFEEADLRHPEAAAFNASSNVVSQ